MTASRDLLTTSGPFWQLDLSLSAVVIPPTWYAFGVGVTQAATELQFRYEQELEDGVARYLDGPFVHDATTPFRGIAKVIANTARGGPRSGKWTQPDLTLVAIQKLSILKRIDLELFSFELKRAGDSDVDSVFEAVAHTRWTHYAYLAWHQPNSVHIPSEKKKDVESNCRAHGIGLIVFADPLLPASYDILLAPMRKSPHPADVEEYLEKRLKAADLAALKLRIHELELSIR